MRHSGEQCTGCTSYQEREAEVLLFQPYPKGSSKRLLLVQPTFKDRGQKKPERQETGRRGNYHKPFPWPHSHATISSHISILTQIPLL